MCGFDVSTVTGVMSTSLEFFEEICIAYPLYKGGEA